MTGRVERPYDDVRVLDLTAEIGLYAGRLFADLGAEVIHVDPPRQAAATTQSEAIRHAVLNANKKSVVIDHTDPRGRQILLDLIATASIVFYEADERRHLLPAILAVPGARVVTVFSHFGLDGPYAGYIGSDLVTQSLGGIAWLSGQPDGAPLRLPADQSSFIASLYGATASAACLWDAETRGNSHLVDISAQECIAHSLQNTLQVYDLEKRIFKRGGLGTRDATENIFRCADGYVFLATTLTVPAPWKALVDWMIEEGHAPAQRLTEQDWRQAALRATIPLHREFREIFESFIATKTRETMRNEALDRKIVMAPVSTIADLSGDPQLLFRDFFKGVADPAWPALLRLPGAPYRLSEPVWSIDRAAPVPGQDDAELLGTGAKRAAGGTL